MRANGGWDNWDMVEIEKYNATDKQDLHKRERYHIETLKAVLNCELPGRTIKEYKKEYCKTHKKEMKIISKTSYIKIKDNRICICGIKYNYGHKGNRYQHFASKHHQAHTEQVLGNIQASVISNRVERQVTQFSFIELKKRFVLVLADIIRIGDV